MRPLHGKLGNVERVPRACGIEPGETTRTFKPTALSGLQSYACPMNTPLELGSQRPRGLLASCQPFYPTLHPRLDSDDPLILYLTNFCALLACCPVVPGQHNQHRVSALSFAKWPL